MIHDVTDMVVCITGKNFFELGEIRSRFVPEDCRLHVLRQCDIGALDAPAFVPTGSCVRDEVMESVTVLAQSLVQRSF